MADDIDFAALSKKERKKLKRELEREQRQEQAKKSGMMKWIIVSIIVIALGGVGWWLFQQATKPLPGRQMADQGRDHVGQDKWSTFTYNSNPPTSGPHDVEWTKPGIYDKSLGDGHLVHSLEHGYVILSYNCNSEISNDKSGTESAEATTSGTTPSPLSKEDCDALKKQLSDLAQDKKIWKLIVIPRPTQDSRIALTAWTRLETLDGFDKEKIVAFIDAHRNHGPEQTME